MKFEEEVRGNAISYSTLDVDAMLIEGIGAPSPSK